ncbi:MAG TPA: hypothetical protein VLH08_21625 [Acidobacteriota bacterium]|nr:hypothetical protein [Acidobacteriota bacterium]
MTRIKHEPNVHQVGTSDLQNAENVRSNSVATKGSENANVNVPVSPEALASKLSEGDLQAKARAAELNSMLNTPDTDQPKPPGGEAFYDLLISSVKDPNLKTGEAKAERLQPKVNSLELENTLVSNFVNSKKTETGS